MALSSTLAKRLFFGTIMTVALAALLLGEGWLACRGYFFLGAWSRGLAFALLAIVFAAGGCIELGRIARAKGFAPSSTIMIVAVISVISSPFWLPQDHAALAGLLLGALLLAGLAQGFSRGNDGTLANLAVLTLGAIYLGLGCWFVLAIRLLGASSATAWGQSGAVLMFLACVKSADIGAYLIGSQIGRRQWVPSISPKKTWEGLCGGIGLAVIVAWLFAEGSGIISVGAGLAFGAVVAVAGQLGDLLESMIKRDAGSKDSAKLVPEFGGVLDLLDSVIVAAPVAYAMFRYNMA